MAGRQAAEIFGAVFTHLGLMPGPKERDLALWLWNLMEAYDFHPKQMECDEELVRLGLARVNTDNVTKSDRPIIYLGRAH